MGSFPNARVSFPGFLGLVLILVFFLYHRDKQESSASHQSLARRSLLLRENSLNLLSDTFLTTRAFDGTCSAAVPCSNGACCSNSGFCGYGPDYCGDTCLSNCDGAAECGQFAKEANATCPLNVCCSQFGFCGTTAEFCDSETCQSNCIEHPDPPSGSETGQVLNKVIGYYEGWNAQSSCHQTLPSDLPVDALTHINFAFGYIDPTTYEIVPMDADTPTTLYTETSALKSINSALKVFISVGGWSFSDNDTVTQPLFGEISADATKRQTFADNVVLFMDTYGFDGIDIDWEYPAASDRGGQEEDTENMVKLFKTLRETFDDSQREYGLTFTIPASYWYLKYFDVPGLLEYADWTNLMSYDIHGTWDRDNEIGSVVNPHTNLTEIQAAVELLWRVDVKPSQIALGFGFYGRSFTLADASCTTPGCAFSNASQPGICTGTGGYMAYYEVQDILANNPDIEPVWDKDAAVKYFSWDTDQWISYDDADTFAQKVEWGNDLGLGGSLIWASDLDDYTFTAHSALLGREVSTNEAVTSTVLQNKMEEVASSLIDAHLDTDCYRFSDCVDLSLKDTSVWSCGSGYTYMGYDRSVCKSLGVDMAQPICCKTETAPKSCTWRGGTGGASYCNGQCHAGEVTLFKSGDGGWPHEDGSDETQCGHGYKYFCCEQPDYEDLLDGCYWTGCGGSCESSESDVAYSIDRNGECSSSNNGVHYCCPTYPSPLENCHWVGQGDCADNTCASTEVTLMTDSQGDASWSTCSWGRKKSLCCTPNYEITTLTCDASLCDTDSTFSCAVDEYGTDTPDEDEAAEAAEDEALYERRDLELLHPGKILDKRADKRRKFEIEVAIAGAVYKILVRARGYPGSSHLHDSQASSRAVDPSTNVYRPPQGTCASGAIDVTDVSDWTRDDIIAGLDTEHNPDLQYAEALVTTAVTGILPSGAQTSTTAIAANSFNSVWNSSVLPNTLTRPSASRYLRTPNDYFMDWFGSNTNRGNLVLFDRPTNQMKGRIFDDPSDASPQNIDIFRRNLEAAVNTGTADAIETLFKPIQEVFAVFDYILHPTMLPVIQQQRQLLLAASAAISTNVPALANFHLIHREFDYDWYNTRATTAQTWVADRMVDIVLRYTEWSSANNLDSAPSEDRVFSMLADYYARLSDISAPPEDPTDTGESDSGSDSDSDDGHDEL